MNRVIEISLIENNKKSKKDNKTLSLAEYKQKIIGDLEDVITLKYFDSDSDSQEIRKSDKFIDIRNKFVRFYNSYIELNGFFIEEKKTKDIIFNLVIEMIDTTIYRSENILNNEELEDIKEVELLRDIVKETKNKLEIDLDF